MRSNTGTNTVGILSFNHPEITARCVRSVLAYVPVSQVHLMHNGSLPKHQDVLKHHFPEIQHHVIKDNRGFTGGTNELLKQVFKSSDWTFFITNDCELISPVVWPDAPGLFAPKIWRRNTGVIDSLGGVFTPLKKKLSHLKNETKKPFIWPYFQHFYVPGTAFMMHTSVFEKVGLFDESLHTYWEDVDYSVRAHKKGILVDVIPEVQIRHAIGKTCHKDKFYTNHLFKRNRDIISRKYMW
jgi:GT2 family glycosyltransferase